MAKYGPAAAKKVASTMRRKKKGTLKSGSGRKVTSRKQAIAIGLSEAREEGAKVPPPKAARKSTARKSTARKTGARKTGARGTGGRKTSKAKTSRKTSRKTTAKTSRKTSAKK